MPTTRAMTYLYDFCGGRRGLTAKWTSIRRRTSTISIASLRLSPMTPQSTEIRFHRAKRSVMTMCESTTWRGPWYAHGANRSRYWKAADLTTQPDLMVDSLYNAARAIVTPNA